MPLAVFTAIDTVGTKPRMVVGAVDTRPSDNVTLNVASLMGLPS